MDEARRVVVMMVGAAWMFGALGCPSEPLTDDRANDVLGACCAEARGRIETVNDVESQTFRERCSGCKRGNTKRECESSAAKVQSRVKQAYGGDPMPISCGMMRGQLQPLGVSIPDVR